MKNSFAFLGAVMIFVVLNACQADQPERLERACAIQELLLNKDDFPVGTILDPINSPIAELPSESAGRTASFNQDLMYVEVARYRSLGDAQSKFDELNQFLFKKDKYTGPWNIPEAIIGFVSNADEFRYACGIATLGYSCRMIGRYDEYIVSLFAHVSDQGITLNQFQTLMGNVESRISRCLER